LADDNSWMQISQQRYLDFFNRINSSMNSAIQGWIQGTQTLGQAFKKMFVSILVDQAVFAAQWLLKKAEMWLMDKLLTKTAQSTTAVDQIISNAAVAYSAAYAATTGIPFVGPALAPEAASSARANVLAIAPMAAFDKGTSYIPRDGVGMLHKGESVSPPPQTQALMDALGNGGNRTLEINNQFTYNAIGDEQFRDLIARNSDHVTSALMSSLRRQNLL